MLMGMRVPLETLLEVAGVFAGLFFGMDCAGCVALGRIAV